MEQIVKEYGRVFLSVVVCAGLLLLLTGMKDSRGNQGILHICGALLEKEAPVSQREDFAVFAREGEKEAPSIAYRDSGTLYVGECTLGEQLMAKDGEGNALAVQVNHISGPGGREWSGETMKEWSAFCFPVGGIYRITATAVDAGNRTTTCVISVPVNDRRKGS